MSRIWILPLIVVSVFALEAGAAAPSAEPAKTVTGIRVLFKSDPLLSGPTYGGERWFALPKFTSAVQGGSVGTVDVQVRGVDASGKLVSVTPAWTPSDSEMLTVSSAEDGRFRITVKRPGEARLKVTAQGLSKELLISAKAVNQGVQVEVSQEPDAPPARAPSPPTQDARGLTDNLQKSSYALGLQMGTALKSKPMTVDPDVVAQGVADALAGRPARLSNEESRAALAALHSELLTRQKEATKRLAEKNQQDAAAFLAENRSKEGVVALESGLQYRVLTSGQGAKPTIDDTVVCHFVGTFIDGKEFDSTHKRKGPATLPVKSVVKGMREALQLMPVGSKWQLFIPPALAYGAKGIARSGIGPNAALVFEVELLSIKGG